MRDAFFDVKELPVRDRDGRRDGQQEGRHQGEEQEGDA